MTARRYASKSKMTALCRSSRAAATPRRKPTVPSASIEDATKSKTTSAASKIGGASLRDTTSSPETSWPPPLSSEYSTGSSCESRPYPAWYFFDRALAPPVALDDRRLKGPAPKLRNLEIDLASTGLQRALVATGPGVLPVRHRML